jgi:heme-degrading monooxygenase HmoA
MIQILGRVKIQDVAVFLGVFATRGAGLRRRHGSRSACVFRVADTDHDVVLLFDWESREAFQKFLEDPEVKSSMKASGAMTPPEFTFLENVADFPA